MNESLPTVSVVIPCHNVATYVRDSIHSVLTQKGVNLEIIFVDNNSTDATWDTLEELKKEIPWITITRELRKGACAARNTGAKLCRGEFIQFLDADDRLTDGKLSRQVRLASDSGADVVVAGYERLTQDGHRTSHPALTDIWKGLFTTKVGLTSSMLFRRKTIENVSGWNEGVSSSQEYDLLFRIMKAGHLVITDQSGSGALALDREGQISKSDPAARWLRYLQLRQDIFEYLAARNDAYWSTNKAYFTQAMFDVIHMVYPYIPSEALSACQKLIPRDFHPKAAGLSGKLFVAIYRIAGLSIAERVKKLLK